MAFIIESVTPFSYRCITYFSQLYDSNPIPSNFKYYYSDYHKQY